MAKEKDVVNVVTEYSPEDVVKKVTYYSPHKRQGFDIPARDEDGNLVPLKDGQGNEVYRKGKKQYQEIHTEFEHIIELRTKNTELLCFKVVDFVKVDGKTVPANPDLYNALERLTKDPSTKIEREETYKNRVNPAAYAAEIELGKAKEQIAELSKKVVEKENAVDAMLKQQAELQKELEEATKPSSVKKKGE
jgi:hypothetical protein